MLKIIPKAQGVRTDLKPNDAGVDKLETKKDTIERLGFNTKQAERFETLSNNREIVEQVKAEARENEDIPTRSRVLQLVKEKTREERDNEYLQEKFKEIDFFINKCYNYVTKRLQFYYILRKILKLHKNCYI